MSKPNCRSYRLILTNPDEENEVTFDVLAQDDDQAIRAALRAYPDKIVADFVPDFTPMVIRSVSEDAYWSNLDGWGDLRTATVFSQVELQYMSMPASSCSDALPVGWAESAADSGLDQTYPYADQAPPKRPTTMSAMR